MYKDFKFSNRNASYVYVHEKKDTGQIFYVGVGTGYRLRSKDGRNNFWKSIVRKHGVIPRIVAVFDEYSKEYNHDCALQYEEYLINYYRVIGLKLCNLTDGGDGTVGYKFSEEAKELMSYKRKEFIKNNPEKFKEMQQNSVLANTGRKNSPETRKKLSKANKGRVPIQAIEAARKKRKGQKLPKEWVEKSRAKLKGLKRSDETKEKIRQSKIGKKRPDLSLRNKMRSKKCQKPSTPI